MRVCQVIDTVLGGVPSRLGEAAPARQLEAQEELLLARVESRYVSSRSLQTRSVQLVSAVVDPVEASGSLASIHGPQLGRPDARVRVHGISFVARPSHRGERDESRVLNFQSDVGRQWLAVHESEDELAFVFLLGIEVPANNVERNDVALTR